MYTSIKNYGQTHFFFNTWESKLREQHEYDR